MELNKKTLRNVFFVVAGCILFYWLLHETERLASFANGVWTMISPFAIGAVLAFVLNVPMRPIERMLKGIKKDGARRGVAILITVLLVLLLLSGVIWLLIPQLIDTVNQLIVALTDTENGFLVRTKNWVTDFLNTHPQVYEWLVENTDFQNIEWTELAQEALGFVSNSLTTIFQTAVTAVIDLGTGVFNGVLSLVFGLYCLSRKEILARQGRRLLYSILPEKAADETIRILRMSNSTFSNFLSGQGLEALILGAMFAITMPIFGMPYVPLVSVIISVTALVPIVGAFAGCIIGAFFILVQDPMLALWFVVLFLVLQQIEGNLIYPRVVGTSIGLPGMWVLVAVAVGGDLMGVGGMLLMIPLASVLYALAREFTVKRLAAKNIPVEKLQDQPPELSSKFKEKRDKSKQKRNAKKLQKQQEKENKPQ